MKNFSGKRILILGAARQGLALARYLLKQGAHVTLNDKTSADQIQPAIQTLEEAAAQAPGSLRWELGGHPLKLLDEADLVCISGGIPLTLPIIGEALKRNTPLSNDTQIFMEAVPCPVTGITGSAGKTTTTTLVGLMAEQVVSPGQRVWVGGNIGFPLIDHLHEIKASDLVILELSSFQLELMSSSPAVAAVLNITPNHLDRHGTLESYTAAKAHILAYQSEKDTAILGWDDAGARGLANQAHGRLVTFSVAHPPDGFSGVYCDNRFIYLVDNQDNKKIMPVSSTNLRGEHNLQNVLAACAILYAAAGLHPAPMETAVRNFKGVTHRLEVVRVLNGVTWINDSIATAPERTIAAIKSFDEPLILLLGGRDKNLPWEELADLVIKRVDHVILFGEAAGKIQQAIESVHIQSKQPTLTKCQQLEEAVMQAARLANPGDMVLLSPGATSYDEFKDFEDRAEHFKQWVHRLS